MDNQSLNDFRREHEERAAKLDGIREGAKLREMLLSPAADVYDRAAGRACRAAGLTLEEIEKKGVRARD